jgi:outer membrane lipoprotein-sorting protein
MRKEKGKRKKEKIGANGRRPGGAAMPSGARASRPVERLRVDRRGAKVRGYSFFLFPFSFLFSSLFILFSFGAAHAASSADWARNWDSIREAARQAKSIKAEFVQKKEMKILAHPLVSTGVFHYAAPDKIRLEYVSPVKSILLMNAKGIQRFFWRDDRFAKDTAMNMDALQVVYRDIRNWLNGDFSSNKSFEPALEPGPAAKIVLTPKDPSMKQFLERIDIGLAARPGVLESIALHEGEAAVTRIEFRAVTLNEVLPESLFEL